jgi:hemerythrin
LNGLSAKEKECFKIKGDKMSFLDWNKDVILNHTTIDSEHKNMVDDTNELYNLVESEKTEEANALLVKIVEDLKGHFETEERLMKESKIPYFISHKLEHERFYKKISLLQRKIDAKKVNLSIDDLKFVKIWFLNHMEFKDRQLAEYLIEKNIS